MDKAELEAKYHKLATEYSKVRSQATVLKKAVLDEQSKILNYKEVIKEQEQKIRKHDQEMDSLTFRNEQLRKRVLVLQQELQNVNAPSRKGKIKNTDSPNHSNFTVIDEELQKRILENAQLASQMADKDIEMSNYKEKIEWLEDKIRKMSVEIDASNAELDNLKQQKKNESSNLTKQCKWCVENQHFKEDADRWKIECDLLRSRPEANEQLTEYYEKQIGDLIEIKACYKSEFDSLHTDNKTMKRRLEHLVLEKNALESILDKSNEELHTTTENYKSQLDAMTEHLAAQNEKITKQCDEIQILKHNLTLKK